MGASILQRGMDGNPLEESGIEEEFPFPFQGGTGQEGHAGAGVQGSKSLFAGGEPGEYPGLQFLDGRSEDVERDGGIEDPWNLYRMFHHPPESEESNAREGSGGRGGAAGLGAGKIS